jgi:hypothetical protein
MRRLKARIRRQQSRWAAGLAICLLSQSVPNWSALAASDSLGAVQGERKLVVYHTTTLPDAAAIAQGFKKKYPFAEVENYRGTGKTNSDFRQRRQQNFHATSWKSVHYPIGCCAFPHR